MTRAPEQLDGAAFDVIVIGGGVVGTSVAARLSSTTARVALIEVGGDVANGGSKGNAGVAVSYYYDPTSLDTQLINESNPRWEELCARLDVPYRRLGGLMIARNADEADRLPGILDDAIACGAPAELITGAQALELEPLVTPDCTAAIHLSAEGVIDPLRLTAAYADIARINGVRFLLGTTISQIDHDGALSRITTSAGVLATRYIVNAAGLGAAEISRLAGGEVLTSWPRKGQYLVVDREFAQHLRKIVFSTQMPDTKGANVVPTTHGSALIGPTAEDIDDFDDYATSTTVLDEVFEHAMTLVPSLTRDRVIKLYAGNRPASDERFRYRFDAVVPNLIHTTSRSSGVSASPAIGDYTLQLLRDAGLDVEDRDDAAHSLPTFPRLRTSPEPEGLVDRDPGYGQVVCACEMVSAAEINHALSRPVPATSIEGIRKRTGATYGRCQGAMCMAGISFMCGLATGTGPRDVRVTPTGTMGARP